MNVQPVIDAQTALDRLMSGNEEYLIAKEGKGDISEEIRILTHEYGQSPYAIVIACSDSRVIPEKIFMVGIGEIFTIRVAGNVIGDFELGSIEYAAAHLNTDLNQVTCLDIGTGTGILLLVAAHLGIKHLVGIDIEEYAANQARINCENNHVSAESLSSGSCFSLISLTETLNIARTA